MSHSERQQWIEAIETERGSRLIAYVTSDRQPPFQAKMSLDVIRPFHEHLTHIAELYAEFAEEDQQLAAVGLAHYAKVLREEEGDYEAR